MNSEPAPARTSISLSDGDLAVPLHFPCVDSGPLLLALCWHPFKLLRQSRYLVLLIGGSWNTLAASLLPHVGSAMRQAVMGWPHLSSFCWCGSHVTGVKISCSLEATCACNEQLAFQSNEIPPNFFFFPNFYLCNLVATCRIGKGTTKRSKSMVGAKTYDHWLGDWQEHGRNCVRCYDDTCARCSLVLAWRQRNLGMHSQSL